MFPRWRHPPGLPEVDMGILLEFHWGYLGVVLGLYGGYFGQVEYGVYICHMLTRTPFFESSLFTGVVKALKVSVNDRSCDATLVRSSELELAR